MNEKVLEKKLRMRIELLGGWALKFPAVYNTGIPDRIVLMPGGRVYFAELKTTGKKPSAIQEIVISKLRKLGFKVFVISTNEQLDAFLGEVTDDIQTARLPKSCD